MTDNITTSAHTRQYPHHSKTNVPYLTCLVPCNQDVPGCQISVHKRFACQALHTWGYILAENKESVGSVWWHHLSWSNIKECLLEALELYLKHFTWVRPDFLFLTSWYNLHWSLLNEVVSEVSICQQLKHNHDLECFCFVVVSIYTVLTLSYRTGKKLY